jgi:hypothetical protein
MLAQDLVGTPFSSGAHKVAHGLMHQTRGALDSLVGLQPSPELKSA